jgi:hypothetical protein
MSEEQLDRSPEARFVRVAERRVKKASAAILSIANLSDRKNYRYTEQQVQELLEHLEGSVQTVREEFERRLKISKPKAATFQFSSKGGSDD